MAQKATAEETDGRRAVIVQAAKWCFLNFGFAKTSLDDIAKRAKISRPLLYRVFRDKEEIYSAVFTNWLVSRHPEAVQAAGARGSKFDRLLRVCQIMVLEPWIDMFRAPMASEFFDVCERLDPTVAATHRKILLQSVANILGDEASAEVLVLALHGLHADNPADDLLATRTRILLSRFVPLPPAKK